MCVLHARNYQILLLFLRIIDELFIFFVVELTYCARNFFFFFASANLLFLHFFTIFSLLHKVIFFLRMSSSSDSEKYTSFEEEFIRTKNYKTRSGRTSRTRYRKEFSVLTYYREDL